MVLRRRLNRRGPEPFRAASDRWVNLHHVLYHTAREVYAGYGERDLVFDDGLAAIHQK